MRYLPFPVPASKLCEFCDPNPSSDFHKPFEMSDKITGASNGWLAMKCDRLDWMTGACDVAQNKRAIERVETLPWDYFQSFDGEGFIGGAKERWEKEWKPLHERRTGLRNWGAAPLWKEDGQRWRRQTQKRVAVGTSRIVVPIAELLMVSSLPKASVYVGQTSHPFLFFRFKGGQGILAGAPKDGIKPSYYIWQPSHDRGLGAMTGGNF